jgi:SET domain-containing protein
MHSDRDQWGKRQVCVDARKYGSLMRFVNHSCTPCGFFYELSNGRRRTIVVATSRPVDAGEEITVSYGTDLWFKCRCVECAFAHSDKTCH